MADVPMYVTPEERAEKLFDGFRADWFDLYDEDRSKFVSQVAAEIRAAVEEAEVNGPKLDYVVVDELHDSDLVKEAKAEAYEEARGEELMTHCYCMGGGAHWLYICDGCKGSRINLTDPDEIKAEAYEDAAKIAIQAVADHDAWMLNRGVGWELKAEQDFISRAIRARASSPRS